MQVNNTASIGATTLTANKAAVAKEANKPPVPQAALQNDTVSISEESQQLYSGSGGGTWPTKPK